MKSSEGLTDLLDDLKQTLPDLPGFRSLHMFGSVPEGRSDGYSDLDLIVTTDAFDQAKASALGLLDRIGPVEFCWVMSLRPDEWNPTIVFRDHGYYHKIDLGIVSSDANAPSIPLEQTVLLTDVQPRHNTYSRLECRDEERSDDITACASNGSPSLRSGEPASMHSICKPIPPSPAYCPPYGSAGHFLLNMFLGGTRYVKARKRGQTMTCYRFVSAAADWCARALYARVTGNMSLDRKLSTEEYRELDSLATDKQHSDLLKQLDYSTPTAMDRAMYNTLYSIADHAHALADIQSEELPEDVIDRFLSFMQQELDVHA